MHPYIKNTLFAAESLITAIFQEEKKLDKLKSDLRDPQELLGDLAEKIDFLERNPDLDDEGLSQLFKEEGRQRLQDQDEILSAIKDIRQSIIDKEFSSTFLCGALLQIAKQGISTKYNGLTACPDGRSIGPERLKNVIWQGRNQSMHYEESSLRSNVRRCFQNLERHYGSDFQLIQGKNLARVIVDTLGWRSIGQYEKDMVSLLG